jgi:hypothetical protein
MRQGIVLSGMLPVGWIVSFVCCGRKIRGEFGCEVAFAEFSEATRPLLLLMIIMPALFATIVNEEELPFLWFGRRRPRGGGGPVDDVTRLSWKLPYSKGDSNGRSSKGWASLLFSQSSSHSR